MIGASDFKFTRKILRLVQATSLFLYASLFIRFFRLGESFTHRS